MPGPRRKMPSSRPSERRSTSWSEGLRGDEAQRRLGHRASAAGLPDPDRAPMSTRSRWGPVADPRLLRDVDGEHLARFKVPRLVARQLVGARPGKCPAQRPRFSRADPHQHRHPVSIHQGVMDRA